MSNSMKYLIVLLTLTSCASWNNDLRHDQVRWIDQTLPVLVQKK